MLRTILCNLERPRLLRTKQPESQRNEAGALKAHLPTRTTVDTVSYEDDDVYAPQSKQPRMNEILDDLDEAEEEFPASSSRWLASEQLAAFLGLLRKPLQSFERKTICRHFPGPMWLRCIHQY